MASGETGIKQLQYFLEKDSYNGKNLTETDVFTHFSPEIPRDAHVVGHFSIPRMISMVPGMPEIDFLPGFLFYGQYANTLFEAGCYWDIGEIKTLYHRFFPFIPDLLEKIP